MYMSPETHKGHPYPFKSDMYSLGIILHFMLTKTFPDYYSHIKTGNYAAVSERYSKDIVDLMARLL